jgi:hypothetical protein
VAGCVAAGAVEVLYGCQKATRRSEIGTGLRGAIQLAGVCVVTSS